MSIPPEEVEELEKKPEIFHNLLHGLGMLGDAVDFGQVGSLESLGNEGNDGNVQNDGNIQNVQSVVDLMQGGGLAGTLEAMFEKIEPNTPPTDNFLPTNSFRPKVDKPNCLICNEVGDGLHFGVEACRACTAFFRRTISHNKKYECRAGGMCEVSTNIRCMCRSCRFDKCMRVGMKPDAVRNKREYIEGAEYPQEQKPMMKMPKMEIQKPIPQFHSHVPPGTSSVPNFMDFAAFREPPMSSFSVYSPGVLPGLGAIPSQETMPLLERMRVNYEKMEHARGLIHRCGESIFVNKEPKAVNFRQATEMTTKEISLVADWVDWCFEDFACLPVDQKTILYQNFFIYFCMLERAFMTVQYGRDGICILASKDYVDYNNLEHFFEECGKDTEPKMNPADIAKHCRLIRPSFELQKRSLINLIALEKIDHYEFFALCTMLFWDFGLEGQSDECNEIGRRVKHRVTREMTFYLRNVKKYEEPLHRMASVVAILPSLQRVVRRFQQDIEMANIFNIYSLPENFYDIVNGKFNAK